MKMRGNLSVERITVEPYLPVPGQSEVRLRENIEAINETMCEFDEYVLHVPSRDGLKEEIEANLDAWLATGRNSEVNMNASLVQKMRAALVAAGVDPDTI